MDHAHRTGLTPRCRTRHHLSSLAGLAGTEFTAAYAASKFAVEGWMEALQHDIGPVQHPHHHRGAGYFRTGLLVHASTTWPEPTIDDYAERTTATVEVWKSINGQQPGDPATLTHALLTIADQNQPPPRFRFLAGAGAIEGATAKAKAKELLAQSPGEEPGPRARPGPKGGNQTYRSPGGQAQC